MNRPEVHPWMRWYLRDLICRIPLLGCGAAQLSGAALITVPPAIEVSSNAFHALESLQVETIRPRSAPVFHLQSVRDVETGREKMFVSLSGSGRWNQLACLERLQEQVSQELGQISPHDLIEPTLGQSAVA